MDSRLNKVKHFYSKNSRLPSYSEMCDLFGLTSKDTINHQVQKWIREGFISKLNNKLSPTSLFFSFPLLGSIQAGKPQQEDSLQREYVSLDSLMGPSLDKYFLKVSGDSMIDAGIHDGDFVMLDKKRQPKQGDIVAALIDEMWTLKYFEKKNGKIKLVAANSNYAPIQPKESLILGGVVINVIRKYY